jgi:NAD(P)H-dependent flavin oxidoreductase YrpB (nitropropane dioxygenase family)
MWSQNVITEKLNIEWPILQAPMAEFTTPALAAAVSNAGGMGALGMWGYSAEEVIDRISGFRALSDGGLNVNYPLWDEPGDLTGVATPMRDCIQRLYHETGLGPIRCATTAVSCPVRLDLAARRNGRPGFHRTSMRPIGSADSGDAGRRPGTNTGG